MITVSFNNEELASVLFNMYFGLVSQHEVVEEDLILYTRMYDMLEDKSNVPKPSSLEGYMIKPFEEGLDDIDEEEVL